MNKEQKILLISIFISLLLHVVFLLFADFGSWIRASDISLKQTEPEEVTFIFPENQPDGEKEIVENVNENEMIPKESNLLSDKNSQARTPVKTDKAGDSPFSEGNSPFSNLASPTSQQKSNVFQRKKFSSKALKGDTYKDPETEQEEEAKVGDQGQRESYGSGQIMDQKKFSVEEVGAISLSTYQWKWAPYINAMKNKLQNVWVTPPAYNRLGLIHGYTVINYTIKRDGTLLQMKVLHHDGHESLEYSSVEAIKALFPFLPLPDDFPEETLTITAKLYYPDLRRGR